MKVPFIILIFLNGNLNKNVWYQKAYTHEVSSIWVTWQDLNNVDANGCANMERVESLQFLNSRQRIMGNWRMFRVGEMVFYR